MSPMSFQTLVLMLAAVCTLASAPPKSKVLRCAVCYSLVSEFHAAIAKVDPRKTIDVGSYRLEADGKQKLKPRKYAGSQLHMLEVMETVCESMKDYAQARHKETGKLEAIKLIEDGAMNPRFGEYDMVQDPDLNKGLEFHCDAIVEDYEDEIVEYFRQNTDVALEKSQEEFCGPVSQICEGVKDEL